MKKYIKEIIISLLQLLAFYVYPITAKDPMTMVFIIIVITFLLSLFIGILSKNKIKVFYPVATAIAFIPSVFIFYNTSALIHALWYLVVSAVAIAVGFVIKLVIK